MPGMGHRVFSRSLEVSAVYNPQFTREGVWLHRPRFWFSSVNYLRWDLDQFSDTELLGAFVKWVEKLSPCGLWVAWMYEKPISYLVTQCMNLFLNYKVSYKWLPSVHAALSEELGALQQNSTMVCRFSDGNFCTFQINVQCTTVFIFNPL